MIPEPRELPEYAVVPFVIGLTFDRAFAAAAAAGVVLAQPDPDGTPLRVLVWGKPVRVLTQDPAAGTVLRYNHSVVVTWAGEDFDGDREPRVPHPTIVDHHAENGGPTRSAPPRDGEPGDPTDRRD